MATRITMHNGRKGKDGVYSTKHNDRNYNFVDNENNKPEKTTKENEYILFHYGGKITEKGEEIRYKQSDVLDGKFSIDKHEHDLYEKTFKEHIENVNERAKKQRHPERIIDADKYRTTSITAPEEILLYIGNKDSHDSDHISNQEFVDMVIEYIKEVEEKYPNVRYLDMSLHTDEDGARHIHARRVYITNDKFGNLEENQTRALADMGIKPPKKALSQEEREQRRIEAGLSEEEYKKLPKSGKERFNNAKITFTAETRNMWLDVCQRHGLDPDRIPKDPSESGKTINEYIKDKQLKETALAKEEAIQAQKAAEWAKSEALEAQGLASAARANANDDMEKVKNLEKEIEKLNTTLLSAKQEAQLKKQVNEAVNSGEDTIKVTPELVTALNNSSLMNINLQKREATLKKSEKELKKDVAAFEKEKSNFEKRVQKEVSVRVKEIRETAQKTIDKIRATYEEKERDLGERIMASTIRIKKLLEEPESVLDEVVNTMPEGIQDAFYYVLNIRDRALKKENFLDKYLHGESNLDIAIKQAKEDYKAEVNNTEIDIADKSEEDYNRERER